MKKEYDTFVLRNEELPDGQECQITIRDLTPGKRKYESFPVKALISSAAGQLPEGDTLWIRTDLGRLAKAPWKIKILERLEDQ